MAVLSLSSFLLVIFNASANVVESADVLFTSRARVSRPTTASAFLNARSKYLLSAGLTMSLPADLATIKLMYC